MRGPQEYERYARQIQLPEIGLSGQEKFKNARVLVIGAGGLGCPVLQYLAAAGVGHIGIADGDFIELSNLQRQPLYHTQDVGQKKAEIAKQRLLAMNPEIKVEIHVQHIDQHNYSLIQAYDLIIDCTDNFASRYLINDACLHFDKPLVYGAVQGFSGQVSVFHYNQGPSYRCLYPEAPQPELAPSCEEIGVLGVLPGLVGTHMAGEAIKIILGLGEILSGKLWLFDLLNNESKHIHFKIQTEALQAQKRTIQFIEQFDYPKFCHTSTTASEDITWEELNKMAHQVQIVDVRQSWEEPKAPWSHVLNIPLDQLASRYHELDAQKPTVVFCQKGIRSLKALDMMKAWNFKQVLHIKEGAEVL